MIPHPRASPNTGPLGAGAHGAGRELAVLTGGASCPRALPSYLAAQLQLVGYDPPLWIYALPYAPSSSRGL